MNAAQPLTWAAMSAGTALIVTGVFAAIDQTQGASIATEVAVILSGDFAPQTMILMGAGLFGIKRR